MGKKQYTQEFKNKIVDLYNLGWTVNDLSKKYGVSVVSVYRWAKNRELSPVENNKKFICSNYKEIKKENLKLKKEVEILKKAMEILAKNA